MRENSSSPSRFTPHLSSSSTIQSLEKPVLKPESAQNGLFTLSSENPKRRLSIAIMPLALIAVWCLASLGERTARQLLRPDEMRSRAHSEMQARTVAASVLQSLGGESAGTTDLQFSTQSAFSVRRQAPVHEWQVVTDSDANHRYLFRINARTKMVYAINRVVAAPLTATQPTEGQLISSKQAQQLAQRYLQSIAGETPIAPLAWEDAEVMRVSAGLPDSNRGTYIFTCRHQEVGVGNRLVKIGIDRQTGDLSYYWNPSGVR